MADTFTTAERSRVMSAVRSRGNLTTEMKAVALFRKHKITGWRRHLPLTGTPDFAFPKATLAVFIDGCFWHKCPTCYRAPKASAKYWAAKAERNKGRDLRVTRELKARGWRVVRIWECELKQPTKAIKRIAKLLAS